MKPRGKPSFRYIDLFSGIGGLRIPFDELGGRCVFSAEIDRDARRTYLNNFGDVDHIFAEDIREIEPRDIPDFDLLLAGFPCQPFSHAGLKKGFNDTRGTLFFEIASILRFHRPKAFLLENVRGLVSHNEGKTFKRILEVLSENYDVQYGILNAKNFGLPQSRARIYIVGFLKTKKVKADIFSDIETYEKTYVGQILERRVPSRYTISDRLWAGHQNRLARHKAKGNGFGYRMYSRKDTHTSTISARYYKDGSEILISQPGRNPRKLTPREAASLQGFPSWFKVSSSEVQAYKQFGNAVPVAVVRSIAARMSKHIQRDSTKRP